VYAEELRSAVVSFNMDVNTYENAKGTKYCSHFRHTLNTVLFKRQMQINDANGFCTFPAVECRKISAHLLCVKLHRMRGKWLFVGGLF
jgi:hypothetical protein